MDGKDVERLVKAAEWCDSHGMDCHWSDSHSCPESTEFEGECKEGCIHRLAFNDPEEILNAVLDLKKYYESLLASERSKVIAEVREYVKAEQYELFMEVNSPNHDVNEFNKWLDSMEPDKGEAK